MAWDVLIKNGTVIDGTGREPVRADVAVQGERIAAIGKLDGSAARVIDAEGAHGHARASSTSTLIWTRRSAGIRWRPRPAGTASPRW